MQQTILAKHILEMSMVNDCSISSSVTCRLQDFKGAAALSAEAKALAAQADVSAAKAKKLRQQACPLHAKCLSSLLPCMLTAKCLTFASVLHDDKWFACLVTLPSWW